MEHARGWIEDDASFHSSSFSSSSVVRRVSFVVRNSSSGPLDEVPSRHPRAGRRPNHFAPIRAIRSGIGRSGRSCTRFCEKIFHRLFSAFRARRRGACGKFSTLHMIARAHRDATAAASKNPCGIEIFCNRAKTRAVHSRMLSTGSVAASIRERRSTTASVKNAPYTLL
jgi:hypothetical protein